MIKLLLMGSQLLIVLVILLVAYSQVIRPLLMGTPVFPMFRRRPNLERKIEETNEALLDKETAKVLGQKMRKLNAGKSVTASKGN